MWPPLLDQLFLAAGLITLIVAYRAKARGARACAVALILPLLVRAAYVASDAPALLALHQIADAVALLALMRAVLVIDRWYPMFMAAFALIATVANLYALAGIRIVSWQQQIITSACWAGALVALVIGLSVRKQNSAA